MIALGNDYAGVFSTSDRMIKLVQKATRACGEKVWPLPIEGFEDAVKGKVGDLKNISGTKIHGVVYWKLRPSGPF